MQLARVKESLARAETMDTIMGTLEEFSFRPACDLYLISSSARTQPNMRALRGVSCVISEHAKTVSCASTPVTRKAQTYHGHVLVYTLQAALVCHSPYLDN